MNALLPPLRPRADPAFGAALEDFTRGDRSGVLEKQYGNGVVESLSVGAFFRAPAMYGTDAAALQHCRGRVLDVGAGCGQHARHLERSGLEVTAIDVLPEAVVIMRDLGLADVREISFFDMPAERFDTLLFLGRTIGFAETLDGLDRVLAKCRELLGPDGQVLLTSLDVSRNRFFQDRYLPRGAGEGYAGEVRFRFAYREIVGPEIRWLYVDPLRLEERARACGWKSEVLCDEGDGNFLARLMNSRSAVPK